MWAPEPGSDNSAIYAKVLGDPKPGNEAGYSLATQQANRRGQKSQSMDHGMPEALSALVQTADQSRERTGQVQVKNNLQLVTINSPKQLRKCELFPNRKVYSADN